MTTKDTGLFSQILTKYLPLFAIFCSGAFTIAFPTMNSWAWYTGWALATVYFALLYLYSKAAEKKIGTLFLVTLVGAIIIAVGMYFAEQRGAVPFVPVTVVVAFIYLWFISHKKWV